MQWATVLVERCFFFIIYPLNAGAGTRTELGCVLFFLLPSSITLSEESSGYIDKDDCEYNAGKDVHAHRPLARQNPDTRFHHLKHLIKEQKRT
jgi:hypothetical protein